MQCPPWVEFPATASVISAVEATRIGFSEELKIFLCTGLHQLLFAFPSINFCYDTKLFSLLFRILYSFSNRHQMAYLFSMGVVVGNTNITFFILVLGTYGWPKILLDLFPLRIACKINKKSSPNKKSHFNVVPHFSNRWRHNASLKITLVLIHQFVK